MPRGEGRRLRADSTTSLIQLNTGGRQNNDVRGDELLAFGAVVDGGLSPDGEFAFDLGVGVDDELELVGIPVAIKGKGELRRIYVGDGP